MADRYWNKEIQTLLTGYTRLCGSFTFNAPSAPLNVDFRGAASVTRLDTGVYQVTLSDYYAAIYSLSVDIENDGLSGLPYTLRHGVFGTTALKADTTAGSPTLTNVTVDTSNFAVGQRLYGPNIAAGSVIQAIPSSNSLTLDQNATSTLAGNVLQCANNVSGFPISLSVGGTLVDIAPELNIKARIALTATTRVVDLQGA